MSPIKLQSPIQCVNGGERSYIRHMLSQGAIETCMQETFIQKARSNLRYIRNTHGARRFSTDTPLDYTVQEYEVVRLLFGVVTIHAQPAWANNTLGWEREPGKERMFG
jgi:hypothetical protein